MDWERKNDFILKVMDAIMNKEDLEKAGSLKVKAIEIRKRIVKLIYDAKGGHIGGSLSSTDILTVLYFDILNIDPKNPKDENRDRFIMSKGHSVEALYCTLAEAGFFDKEILNTYGKFNSPLTGHPVNKIPGIELNSGALGHGLGVGVGMALAGKMNAQSYKVYVLMGDGEQGEGSIYEAAMAASHYKLNNLIAIIDRNGLQISGSTEKVMSLENMKDRWEAFGWNVIEMDGNDMQQLLTTFRSDIPVNDSPTLIIAKTVKGKGISIMENKAEWHHKAPTNAEVEAAMTELNNQI